MTIRPRSAVAAFLLPFSMAVLSADTRIDTVVERVRAYVEGYQKRFSAVVAAEDYTQQIRVPSGGSKRTCCWSPLKKAEGRSGPASGMSTRWMGGSCAIVTIG